MTKPQSRRFLGVRIDDVTYAETLERIGDMMGADKLHHVVTVNAEFVMAARQQPDFRRVIEAADLAVPDGAGPVLVGRLTGRRLRQRVAGVDLVDGVARRAAKAGWRLYLLGAGEGVAQQAANVLTARYPELVIAGTYAGSPQPEAAEAIIDRINQADTDILLVAYGAPRQDLWIDSYRARLDVRLAMGVGGSFDFLAGKARRAPTLMRRLGLEWLWRLILEPWRWRRMLVLPRFFIAAILEHSDG